MIGLDNVAVPIGFTLRIHAQIIQKQQICLGVMPLMEHIIYFQPGWGTTFYVPRVLTEIVHLIRNPAIRIMITD